MKCSNIVFRVTKVNQERMNNARIKNTEKKNIGQKSKS